MVLRITKIDSKFEEIENINNNVLSKDLLPINVFNSALLFPIKYGNGFFHLSIKKENIDNLSDYISFFNNEKSLLSLKLNNNYLFFDAEFNITQILDNKSDDFKLYLHPRKQSQELKEEFIKELKIFLNKIKQLKLTNFFIISSSKTEKLLKNENLINLFGYKIISELEFDELLKKDTINKKDYFEYIKNKKTILKSNDEFKSFFNKNIVINRKKELFEKYGEDNIRKRVLYELNVIEKKGFQQYFKNFFEIVNYLKTGNYPYFIRGSASGSIVLYLLGISNLNPIKYQIDFDRFLGGNKTADIDIDIPGEDRDSILLGLKKHFEKKGLDVFKIGMKTSFHSDKFVTHPAGILIENQIELDKILPLQKIDENYSASIIFDSGSTPILAKLNFLKYDLLSSNIISKMKKQLEKKGLNINHIISNWENEIIWKKDFYEKLLNGSFFQFSSESSKFLLKQFEPKSYEDLVKLIAINRPALLGNKMISIKYILENLEIGHGNVTIDKNVNKILSISNSGKVILFQDQVLEFLKYVLPELDEDIIIKLAKGRTDVSDYENLFINNLNKKINDLEFSKIIWSQIKNFSNYGLNKAHSYSYGVITYLELFSD